MGISSRVGDMSSKLGYGWLLHVLTWQQVTRVAAAVGVVAAGLGYALHRDNPGAADSPGIALTMPELRLILQRRQSQYAPRITHRDMRLGGYAGVVISGSVRRRRAAAAW